MLKNIFLLISLALVFSSCIVSKKKYDALLIEKNQLADYLSDKTKENKELEGNLNQAISDFELMKNDFGKSNSLRSDEIADLMIKVTKLEDESIALNTKFNETLGKFKAKEKAGYLAEEDLKNSQRMISALKRDTASLHYSIQMAKDRSSKLQEELMASKKKLSETGLAKVDLEKELENQTKSIKNMEQKLIKSQQNISEVSKLFIELRKELLTAKSNNQPLDPNKNSNINKIAKQLGHY
ncbi:hypothetical protein [Carboxylicivirga sp. N1Y90]|uniref:hypothetical protein n=1 Tax=Carboxylicivirga fragile TaxID=3417571 RepID=UPI003D347502|nr:hypothetical protein [Marinilabiliaceae bacterium N1Y90]